VEVIRSKLLECPADAGHEFAVTLGPDHAQAIRENGLRVEARTR
jgi:hypothetical protein